MLHVSTTICQINKHLRNNNLYCSLIYNTEFQLKQISHVMVEKVTKIMLRITRNAFLSLQISVITNGYFLAKKVNCNVLVHLHLKYT